MSSNRFRPWEIIFYGSKEELFSIFREYRQRIAHYALILHDRDTYEEDEKDSDGNTLHNKGDLKKVHFHVLVEFFNAHSFSAVKKMFTTDVDKPRVENIVSRVAKYEYLIHKGYPEKYQYSKEDIISDDINFYENLCKIGDKPDKDNIAEQIVNDILANVAPHILVSRYGRDFVIHMSQYYDCAYKIKQWKLEHSDSYKLFSIDPVMEDIQGEIPFE